MTFKKAVQQVQSQPVVVRTTNGAKAFSNTGNGVLDYFSKVGASRGKDNVGLFLSAFNEDQDLAIRALLWTRDVRGGAGERQTFKDILSFLASNNLEVAKKVIAKVPEVGRWDDLLCLFGTVAEAHALALIEKGIKEQNGLCAKWMPRKGAAAEKIRNYLQFTPKQYRKTLVNLTQVVEQKMCAKQWDDINFSHVPSKASINYKKAFARNTENYQTWLASLASGEKSVKVNAGAVYPHEVVKPLLNPYKTNSSDITLANAQWEALPNYVPENSSVLPMIDVSGSMCCPAGGSKSVQCIDVSVGLGLYLSTKNTGAFKDTWLNFSSTPKLQVLKGSTIHEKWKSVNKDNWGMSTNLEAAFEEILRVAVENKVPNKDMPKTLVIFSDMQFDRCVRKDHSLRKNLKLQYKNAGYDIPKVVFWNLNDYGNSAAKFDSDGTALVSGFSPSLLKAVLDDSLEDFTPYNVMLKTLQDSRYDY